jgi:hypothetical protein
MSDPADVISRQGLLERNQKAYYRLAVQTSVAISLIAIYTLHEYQEFADWRGLFLALLVCGQLTHLLSPPTWVKKASAAASVAGGIGVFILDPTTSLLTVVASTTGVLSGGLSYLHATLDERVAATRSLVRFAEYHSLYQLDQLLNRLGFKRPTSLGITFRDSISKLLTQRTLTYSIKRDGQLRRLQMQWSEGFSNPIVWLIARQLHIDPSELQP